MARLANVVRRHGTYHFRRVIPAALRERLQRRELVRSLDVRTPSAAKLSADLLYRASERLFVAAAQPMLSPDLLARLVRDFYDLNLTINDHQRLLDGPLTDEGHAVGVVHLDTMLGELRQALARNRFDHDAVGLATSVVHGSHGCGRTEPSPVRVRRGGHSSGVPVPACD